MDNTKWEDQLRDLLGEYKPGETYPPLENEIAPETETQGVPTNPEYPNPEETERLLQQQAWKRIEASLDASDQAFDESLKRKVYHYGPQYDPQSWPLFLQRFADSRFLRTKLILLKTIEVSALILLLLTAVNMGRLGKLDLHSNTKHTDPEQIQTGKATEPVSNTPDQHKQTGPSNQNGKPNTKKQEAGGSNLFTENGFPGAKKGTDASRPGSAYNPGSSNSPSFALAFGQRNTTIQHDEPAQLTSSSNLMEETSLALTNNATVINTPTAGIATIGIQSLNLVDEKTVIPEIPSRHTAYLTEPLDLASNTLHTADFYFVPSPSYVKTKPRTYTEFGVLIQSDYNGLRMPEDRLYTAGQQIIFPEQGIISHGFGGGFTIALGHPVWAVETGVIYSAKDFKPGRQLIVGGVFDNGSVDFEAMRLQLVSIPVQYRYRFDHSGRLRMYALAGAGLNVIVESITDVHVKYHFPSLSFGENPNSNPDLAETIEETRQISEHFRDGAPFSTKSFLSVNAGVGLEYQITEYKTLFLQTTIQYQIPELEFSNNNGKHLRSASLQVGVRTPLGK